MRNLQNNSRSNSSSSINSQTGDIVENFGWESKSESIEEKNREFEQKLIKLANKKINLLEIFNKLSINFSNIIYSPSGWTHNTNCPFKDHNDNSPSFWYNSLENRFNCFGCSRGGGTVQFLSIYHNKKQILIANEILKKYSDIDEIYEDISDELNKKMDKLLIETSEYFKNFMKKNINNINLLNFAENLLWSLDIYLEKLYVIKYDIEFENLKARIDIMKRKLNYFE